MHIPDMIFQGETNECGLACISMLAQTQGVDLPLDELRLATHPSTHGMSLAALCDIVNAQGISAYPALFDYNELVDLPLPAILHYGASHYVLLLWKKGNYICLMNPAIGQQILPLAALKQEISGYALLLDEPIKKSTAVKNRSDFLSLFSLSETAKVKKLYPLLFIYFVMSLTLFIMPVMVGTAINHSFSRGDISTLPWQLYFLAFFLATLLAIFAKAFTESIIRRFMMTGAAAGFSRLLDNTQLFFDKRAPGDIFSRFSSWQQALAQKIELDNSLRIDWVIVLMTLVAMYVINPILALVSSIGILLTGLISSWALFRDRYYTQKIETHSAEQNDYVFETLRGISTIKSAGLENMRKNGFAHHSYSLFHVLQKHKVYEQIKNSLYQLIGNLEMVIFMLVALPMVTEGKISLGYFFAYSFIRQIFNAYVTRIFYTLIGKNQIRVIDRRAEDLFPGTGETHAPQAIRPAAFVSPLIFTDLRFAYTAGLPVVSLKSFTLQPNESVAIVGESGAGKSTFLRLLAGLLESETGEIEVNGQTNISHQQLRSHVFLQSQEDILFHGSILQNITLFDADYDESKRPLLNQILQGLQLREVIETLPGGLNALVREDQSGLSLGQRQRLLLARALYSARPIILLDEPTANLDETTLALVMNWILEWCRNTGKTLVTVTHNTETASLFDRIFTLQQGTLLAGPVTTPIGRAERGRYE
jgi:ATP-binding cassette subfamily B protein RaxB